MEPPAIHPNMLIADVHKHYPATIPVFNRHQMACVGCAMAPLMTLADAMRIYRLEESYFLNALREAIQPSLAGAQTPLEDSNV